jgi:hypothetical protein
MFNWSPDSYEEPSLLPPRDSSWILQDAYFVFGWVFVCLWVSGCVCVGLGGLFCLWLRGWFLRRCFRWGIVFRFRGGSGGGLSWIQRRFSRLAYLPLIFIISAGRACADGKRWVHNGSENPTSTIRRHEWKKPWTSHHRSHTRTNINIRYDNEFGSSRD